MRTFASELEFHAARRMWAVTDHGVHVAAAGDTRTHYEWLCSWFGAESVSANFATTTRGYVLDGVLVAYRGHDMNRWVDQAEVVMALDELQKHCGPIETVCLGVRRGDPGVQPWPPVVKVPAAKFLAHVVNRRAGNSSNKA